MSTRKPRPAEQARMERDLADHAEYVGLCEARNLTPMPLGVEWSMTIGMWGLGPHFIPYIASTGSVWVRDLRHKTSRKDRPLFVANLLALKEKK